METTFHAGIIRRLAAYTIDIMILAAAVVASQFGLQVITGGFPANRLQTGLQIEAWVFATVSLPTWAYFTFMERSAWQASLLPTPIWSEAASASLRPGLVVANTLLVLYVVIVILTPRRQSVHDLIAGTIVFRRSQEGFGR
jgi:uncharacterized RDD family membrane protein YckC